MALLEGGLAVADPYAEADEGMPAGPAVFPLARLQSEPGLLQRNQQTGVLVGGDVDPEALRPLLDRLSLVAVRFPVFKDGRGFTLGRTLRERFNYRKTLRATGHVLPDQYDLLYRCGFDQVETPDADLAPWFAALTRFHIAYQPSTRDEPAVGGLLRRRLRA